MAIERHGAEPRIASGVRIAPTARLVGDVRVGEDCVIDYGVVITSTGPPVVLGRGTVVMANAVVRSVGGEHRPAFPVSIGDESLIGPLAALAGCTIGDACYVATGVMVFHGASVATGARLGAGSIVHTGAQLPAGSRVGMRQYAVPGTDGATIVTGDLDEARELLAVADFFARAFANDEPNLEALHRQATAMLRAEAAGFADLPVRGSTEGPGG
jgi:carbonic anhydrase/acetyltransferase-like protein (isoleucine patch superfamily)